MAKLTYSTKYSAEKMEALLDKGMKAFGLTIPAEVNEIEDETNTEGEEQIEATEPEVTE